jgi:hypothetical protein
MTPGRASLSPASQSRRVPGTRSGTHRQVLECASPLCSLHGSLAGGHQSQGDCVLQPRVARHELPWVKPTRRNQPQRGCASPIGQRRNPVGVEPVFSPSRASQPRALRLNPFGILNGRIACKEQSTAAVQRIFAGKWWPKKMKESERISKQEWANLFPPFFVSFSSSLSFFTLHSSHDV